LLALLWAGVLAALAWVAVFPLLPVASLLARDSNGTLLDLIRSHRTTVPFHMAWSSEGWRWIGWTGRLLPLLAVLGAILVGLLRHHRIDPSSTLSRRQWASIGALVVAGSVVLFWIGRVPLPVLITYGDSIALIPQIAQGTWVFPAEPLMMHLFNAVSLTVKTWRGSADGLLAGQLTALVCGAAFAASLWTVAAKRSGDLVGAVLLFVALAGTGTTTQFFGVVETTLLQTAAIAAFLTACALVLQAPARSPARDHLLLLVHLCMGVVLSAHAAGVALLPALVTLWVVLWRREARHDSERPRRLLSARNLGGALLGGLGPWLLFVWWPFLRLGNFGNSAGGADRFRFVPWDVDAARQASAYVYYAMLSRLHALDVTAALVAACPFALLLLFSVAVLRRRAGAEEARIPLEPHLVFLMAGLGGGAVALLWDFDFGMWGDWNIVTCYLLPLHVASWLLFHDTLRHGADPGRARWLLSVPLVIAQVALGLGMWLQFHPPGLA
jgi:hypothetical protein